MISLDPWRTWADGWDAWDATEHEHSARDGFAGYDLWKSDVGPWPSTGDAPRPTRPTALTSVREGPERDLTTSPSVIVPASEGPELAGLRVAEDDDDPEEEGNP